MKMQHAHARNYHWCPGCDQVHPIPDEGWTFSGNQESPTFTPSVKHTWGSKPGSRCCHYFVTDGVIHYCSDSTHPMAGRSLPLPELPPSAVEQLRATFER